MYSFIWFGALLICFHFHVNGRHFSLQLVSGVPNVQCFCYIQFEVLLIFFQFFVSMATTAMVFFLIFNSSMSSMVPLQLQCKVSSYFEHFYFFSFHQFPWQRWPFYQSSTLPIKRFCERCWYQIILKTWHINMIFVITKQNNFGYYVVAFAKYIRHLKSAKDQNISKLEVKKKPKTTVCEGV